MPRKKRTSAKLPLGFGQMVAGDNLITGGKVIADLRGAGEGGLRFRRDAAPEDVADWFESAAVAKEKRRSVSGGKKRGEAQTKKAEEFHSLVRETAEHLKAKRPRLNEERLAELVEVELNKREGVPKVEVSKKVLRKAFGKSV